MALLGRTRASEFLSRNVGCFLTACLKALVLAVTVQGRLLDESFSIRTATGDRHGRHGYLNITFINTMSIPFAVLVYSFVNAVNTVCTIIIL